MAESRQINPIQDLFKDLEKIVNFIEVKDQFRADKYETQETRDEAEMWMNAVQKSDTYVTYHFYWTPSMFQEVSSNVKMNNVKIWMNNPYNVPLEYQDNLLLRGREAYFAQYEEKNNYYRMIAGLPSYETTKESFIYPSKEIEISMSTGGLPIHKLSTLTQNRYMTTDEYQNLLKANPDKEYLKYIGLYKIDTFSARKARDYELIRYLPMGRSDINPNLLKEFSSLYTEYRNYVMRVLYNQHLESIYENYRNFMGLIIKSFVLMQISNKAVEGSTNNRFLDDAVLHMILSMYGIPKSLLMTKEVRRSLVTNILKLTREKATDEVYYNLVQILGYQDIIISKLMLMRGQQFDPETGKTSYNDGKEFKAFSDMDEIIKINPNTEKPFNELRTEPYFIGVDIKDPNPYDTIINGDASIHSYHSIIDTDPTWWDLEDTQSLLRDNNYSIADSKYIMIEAVIHQTEYLFEAIYFMRMILDNKVSTDAFNITIPEIFGTEPVSIYDLMCFILSATCILNGTSGSIQRQEEGMFATAGFNFEIDLNLLQSFIDTTKYLDKDRIMKFIENLSIQTPSDISRLFNEIIYPMRYWLQNKIAQSQNRHEFLEYEAIYKALYTYDVARNTFLDDFEMPVEIIRKRYSLTEDEMKMYKHFYPRHMDGKALAYEDFLHSRYPNPLSNNPRENEPITWFIDIPYKGRIYLHDILNSDDVRNIVAKEGEENAGEYLLMDRIDDGDGNYNLELDRDAVRDLLEMLSHISEEELKLAEFRTDTFILDSNGLSYIMGERLPANIRSGIFKSILIDKIKMDIDGRSYPPTTYLEYLYRKNSKLYNLLIENNRFEYNREVWMNDIMTIVLSLETELNMHLKHFEQSIVGSELFFKPLITLIKHFKSTFVNFAKTGLRYVFGDKIDSGGSSNMFKLFDYMATTVHFVILARRGYEAQFGLYDTEHRMKHKIILSDRSGLIGDVYAVNNRRSKMGSIRMVDEMKFFKNGTQFDPSGQPAHWSPGESNSGRWEQDHDIIMRVDEDIANVTGLPVDTEGWKEFVESYTPNE